MGEPELAAWQAEGEAIAGASLRAWEAAGAYFQASPAVRRRFGAGDFARWTALGHALAADAGPLAAA